MHLDNSACNLASLNLLQLLDDDGTFDVEAFKPPVEVIFTAQEILVGNADYPTEAIGETSRRFRQLGIGYANLGAMLMALGLPYDSDEGRALAAAVTSLMTGHAYATSARTAARMGPFAGLRRERGAHAARARPAPGRRRRDRRGAGAPRAALGRPAGVGRRLRAGRRGRRAQLPGLGAGPHRHHRPDDGLRHHRHRARPRPGEDEEAGGRRHHVDRQPDRCPVRCSASATPTPQIDEIVAYIDENKSILGAPHLEPEHVPVFACSMGDNTIHYSGHVRMMGAVQPFISGAISKTVNMPEEATVEEVEQLHIDAWQLGIKAVAIYRDNCKVAQPLSTAKKADERRRRPATVAVETIVERIVEKIVHEPIRQKLPAHPGLEDLRVPGGRLQGLRHRRRVRGRPSGRDLRAGVQAGLDPRRHHGRLRHLGQPRPPVRRAAAQLRRGLHRHALRARRHDRRPRHPDRQLADGLPVPPHGDRVPLPEERAELNILTTAERMQPTLPGVEESIVETRQGSRPAVRPAVGRVGLHPAGSPPITTDAPTTGAATTPRCACSAASPCSGPAAATPAPAAAPPAAAADRVAGREPQRPGLRPGSRRVQSGERRGFGGGEGAGSDLVSTDGRSGRAALDQPASRSAIIRSTRARTGAMRPFGAT